MKETHDAFEVSAERAFEMAQSGDVMAARRRLAAPEAQASALDSAVRRFLEARVADRVALQREYQAMAFHTRLGLVLVGAALLAFGVLLGRHLMRRVVVPLEQLTAAAQLIRSGDAQARVPPQRYRELKEMATAFNEMADSVQFARETVELQNEELRQSLEQLQETQEELVQREKLSAMGHMLAGLAHELNNPLAAVLGMSEVLRAELARANTDAARRIDADLGEPLQREALRARALVRNLLNFARKPSGTLEPVALYAAVSTAVALRSHAYLQAGKTLRVDIPQSLYVRADVQKLEHCVVNLVNNALDAMVSDHGTGLRIGASVQNDGMVRVDFDDDGPGFEDPQQALTPFFTTKAADHGTGLGLALVQKFVNEFGGTATASNRPGGGARVSLLLRPAPAPERAAPVGTATDALAAPSAANVASTFSPGPRLVSRDVGTASPRVLVVDDEPSLREVQRRLLTPEGIDVLLAANAAEARDVLGRERVDLVISDLRMPGGTDGRGLIAWLTQEYPALAGRTLLVTGDVSGAVPAALPVPPERLISKPFSRDEYVARVRAALGMR